jgi:hypothetical protein
MFQALGPLPRLVFKPAGWLVASVVHWFAGALAAWLNGAPQATNQTPAGASLRCQAGASLRRSPPRWARSGGAQGVQHERCKCTESTETAPPMTATGTCKVPSGPPTRGAISAPRGVPRRVVLCGHCTTPCSEGLGAPAAAVTRWKPRAATAVADPAQGRG